MLRLIKRCTEYIKSDRHVEIPYGLRGVYVLYHYRPRLKQYDVVYVGMSDGRIRSRIRSHLRTKSAHWTHFSLFEVWDNVYPEEIRELEGLFRHIYRRDSKANRLNKQRGFRELIRVREPLGTWD